MTCLPPLAAVWIPQSVSPILLAMPFRRFFGGKDKDAPPSPAAADPETDEPQDAVVESDAGADSEIETEVEPDDVDYRTRARGVLPTGASTGSKRAESLYGSADAVGPTHFSQAVGCRVIDVDGLEYVDCTMALGSVALGYAETNVTRAVVDTIATGNVSGLSSRLEVEIAERLCGVIPCADRVQFLKTGAEAMAAAVRIARTYTGRELVIVCGYFGWLDWCADDAAGVPQGTRAAIRRVAYDDVAALEAAVSEAGASLAAIVIEPVIERLPSTEWIAKARELATSAGAVLVFDEIKTGFRLRTGGYQQLSGVTPDLAAFGKAMANGFPLAAVVGDRAVMDAAKKTWISSTLASEASALAAAFAVLTWHDSGRRVRVARGLWRRLATGRHRRHRGCGSEGRDCGWPRRDVALQVGQPRSGTALPRARGGERRAVQARRVQLFRAGARRRRAAGHRGRRERGVR